MSTYEVPADVISQNLTMYENDRLNVLAMGLALSCTANGGQIHVKENGVAQNTVVFNSGWLMLSGGNGASTLLKENGSETIANNATETGATIAGGGIMYVNRGLCDKSEVYSGGSVQVGASGSVRSTTVFDGGQVVVSSGGNANKCEVSSGGLLLIGSGGIGQSNTVLAGGRMNALEKTTLYYTTAGNGGTGNALLEINGGIAYETTVNAGGSLTFTNNEALGSMTVIRGGVIQGGDLLLSRNTADADAQQCAVRFEDGGTITLSTLTIRTGGQMRVDSKTTVHFQNIILDGNPNGFRMKSLAGYDPASGTCRKLLDCTAETTELWTDAQYRTLLNATTPTSSALYDRVFLYKDGDLYLRGIAHVSSGATGEEAFATVQAALAMSPTGLVIEDGVFSTSGNRPTFEGVTTTINGGLFTTSVCGGILYAGSDNIDIGDAENEQNISLSINGGTFNKIVFAGDRMTSNYLTLTRYGDITTTISGGTFNSSVAGAMAVTGDITIRSKLVGNVFLTINGGTFQDSWDDTKETWKNVDWIYGGSIATTKTIGATTTIEGNVTVTLDATNNAITVGNLVAGSYGYGKITGNTDLVLKGANNITATGEIWGGCSGDSILYTKIKKEDGTDSGNREVTKMVSGSRILTFTGFAGVLTSEANKIRAFSDIEVKGNSDATVANAEGGSVNFSDIVNWTFENGSRLTGNFVNDFNGDTLNLLGFTSAVKDYVLMTDSNLSSKDIFNAFDQLTAIRMDGNSVSATFSKDIEAQTMTWSWNAGSTTGENPQSWLAGSLEVNRTTGKMTLTTIA